MSGPDQVASTFDTAVAAFEIRNPGELQGQNQEISEAELRCFLPA
jgi:hypothetical protein